MAALSDWVRDHAVLLNWLGVFSSLMFVGSLLLIPWLVAKIPSDYFLRRQHLVDRWRGRHPLLRVGVLAVKNLCGCMLIGAGIAMLVLPGQGILTIVVGIILLDFPGKFALERSLARRRSVLRALNWIRTRMERPPLESPRQDEPHATDSDSPRTG